MVVKNEADRYLEQCVRWNFSVLDDLLVYDDASEDESVSIAQKNGAVVVPREDEVPPFIVDESAFRQAAWEVMEDIFSPTPDDWILCLDADEFLVYDGPDQLEHLLNTSGDGVVLPVDEIFLADGAGQMYRRVDGYWGQITALRLVRYRPGGTFKKRRLGGGSVPTYVQDTTTSSSVRIAHLGYLDPLDRAIKHSRYSSIKGHSTAHVESILTAPELEATPWRHDLV